MRRIAALLIFAVLALAGPSASTQMLEEIIAANEDANLLADARCYHWSEGCKTCKRTADGRFQCSNPGIACQPKEPTCTGAKAP
jgi:hypothetical protein